MSGDLKIAVVGATGAVGSTMLEIIEERDLSASEVVPFASQKSAGKLVDYRGQSLAVQPLNEKSIVDFDIALFSAGGSLSREWAPRFVKAGAVVVDNSSAWRMEPNVPLVIAEVNPEDLDEHSGLIANPNCTAMQMIVALGPIYKAVGIERIVVSTYQSTSGTGKKATEELFFQSRAVLEGKDFEPKVYPHQIAFNILPQVEVFVEGDDYSTEERKVVEETRKILHDEKLGVSATCVRVPVYNCHSESINIQTREPLSADQCREILDEAPSVIVEDEPYSGTYPLAVNVSGRDEVFVGRIREDASAERCLNMWVVGDNLRKGAATNAVQLAELLIERDLLRKKSESAAE